MIDLKESRKSMGLCIDCGDRAKPGCTRCVGCLQVIAVKQKMRRKEMSDEKKAARREYERKWMAENPDRIEVYKSRKSEYNRRYRNGY